jgi:hypothetical protein
MHDFIKAARDGDLERIQYYIKKNLYFVRPKPLVI